MAVPPVAAEAAGIAVVPTKTAVNADTPARPKGRSVRMNSPPVVHSANLILPAIVDAGHTTSIKIGPRRTIADGDVVTNIDLPDIYRPIVNDVVSNIVSIAISNVWSIADAVAHTRSIADAVAHTRSIADAIVDSGSIPDAIVDSRSIPDPVTYAWTSCPR